MNIDRSDEENPENDDLLGFGNSQFQDSVAPEADDSFFYPQESAELIQEPEDINESCILFHVVCGDQVGEEFLVHADCSVGVMMDFIKRRLMEDMSLPEESRIELFDENGKSLKIHLADPRERGTKFVKQRGVYFPMYFIPEYVPSEFDERELSQSLGNEQKFDDVYTVESKGEYLGDEEEELIELHIARKNFSSPRSSSSSEMETLKHQHHANALMTEMPEDGYYNPNEAIMAVVPTETGSNNNFEEVYHDFGNLGNPYRQEYPGEGQMIFPLTNPLQQPKETELEVCTPESPVTDDDDFDKFIRAYQDEEVDAEGRHGSESHLRENQEFDGEGYEYKVLDNNFTLYRVPSQNLQKVPSETESKEPRFSQGSHRKENFKSDSVDDLDNSNFLFTTQALATHPPKKHKGESRLVFVPIIAGTFDGCVAVCQWVVEVHDKIDRGVKDMEEMINEAVASQDSRFVDKINKRSGQKDDKDSFTGGNKSKHPTTHKNRMP